MRLSLGTIRINDRKSGFHIDHVAGHGPIRCNAWDSLWDDLRSKSGSDRNEPWYCVFSVFGCRNLHAHNVDVSRIVWTATRSFLVHHSRRRDWPIRCPGQSESIACDHNQLVLAPFPDLLRDHQLYTSRPRVGGFQRGFVVLRVRNSSDDDPRVERIRLCIWEIQNC